jgi:hypothetical protein
LAIEIAFVARTVRTLRVQSVRRERRAGASAVRVGAIDRRWPPMAADGPPIVDRSSLALVTRAPGDERAVVRHDDASIPPR